jgi:hypothetical protein
MLCAPACATTDPNYNYEGFPLTTVESGIVQGDVYVSCGDHAGLTGTSYATNTFITNFTNVPTSGVKYAELKVGVWGGSPARVGYAETKLNGTTLSTETLDITDLSNNVECSGSGVYLIHYNCTSQVQNLTSGTIEANVTAWPELGLGSTRRLDSRIYGAVLIVVYENGTSYTQYWINQGDLNLHKNVTATIDNTSRSFSDFDANLTQFNGAVNGSVGGNATLTVGYFAGDDDQNDYLYFNPPQTTGSPYYTNNFNWDLDEVWGQKLDGNNVANETCALGSTTNFDLHTFGVTANSSSNYAVFWRGHGNNTDESEIYDPAWPNVNPNTESYVSPFLAVLKIKP